jgi:arylsulfatase
VGGIRTQFHHVIDIVPTILEATGIPAPDTINGITQLPMNGVSMVYTWDKTNANAPSKHTTQYFEILGNRAIYHEGWVACTTPVTTPWDLGLKPTPDVITGYNWELYNIAADFSQADDLAAQMPDKVKQMQDLFYAEAKKYDVLPLDNSSLARFLTPRPSPTAGRTTFTYSGELSGVPPACAPSILGRSYTIEADVEVPETGAEGMIVTEGGRFGGYGLYLAKGERGTGGGKIVFLYNLLGSQSIAWEGPVLKPGKHTIEFAFKYDGPGFGKGGIGTLKVDGKVVATKSLEHTVPIMFPEDEAFDVGMDTRTPVAFDAFKFTGKLDKLTFSLGLPEYVAAPKP